MIKAIIFDLDNTLVDFMKMKHASCEEAISAMIDAGLHMEKEAASKLLFELYDKYGIEHKEIFQKFLIKATGKIDYKVLASGIVAYRRLKNGYLTPYPGVNGTLIKLKNMGIKLAVLSDAPRLRAWTRLAATRLSDFFDAVVTFDDTKKYKPNSKPFKLVLEKIREQPCNVLMVGDWPERDIMGAKKTGIQTCYAKYGAVRPLKNIKSNFVVNSFKELIDVVEKENK